ncbi:hypothetical protein PU560_15995 [Georgenia sp. 10Sc9-8]|uniref:Fibronectin type-III domain-containing protein n=1 Tax=Georgenia halotolerans TaxID=3028317 RepID=A0ABT5U232_9MICO|nr:hypothetical protein [Georgenia halotolerans]
MLGLGVPQTAAAPGRPMPTELTVEQRTQPTDVGDLAAPSLGWQTTVDEQTAYQIQVAEDRPGLASGRARVWDSGTVTSTASTHVAYAGSELEPGESYTWRVRTWDGSGKASPWSLPARFGTALGGNWGASEPIWLGPPAALGWRDYMLETTFSITAGGATIAFNAQGASNYLMWQFRGDANEFAPHERVNGTFDVLKTVPLDVELQRGTDYRLRIEVDGATVRTYLDDHLIDTTTDVPFTQGTIGFRTGGSERNS